MRKQSQHPFKWRQFQPEIIVLCVRWYLRYALSSRDLEEMMLERGLHVDHTTISRLSLTRDAEAAKGFFLKALQSSACLTTSPELENEQMGRKAEFSALEPVLGVINTEKNAAYPKAIADLKAAGLLPECVELRHVKYLNNLIEQDHRFVKRFTKPGMGFFSFETAWRTFQGYEAMNMIRKGQLPGVAKGDVRSQIALISELFGVAA